MNPKISLFYCPFCLRVEEHSNRVFWFKLGREGRCKSYVKYNGVILSLIKTTCCCKYKKKRKTMCTWKEKEKEKKKEKSKNRISCQDQSASCLSTKGL